MSPVIKRIICGVSPVLIINNYNYGNCSSFTGSLLDFCWAVTQPWGVEKQLHTGLNLWLDKSSALDTDTAFKRLIHSVIYHQRNRYMCQPCYQKDNFQTKPTSNKKLRIGSTNLICSKDAFHLSGSAKAFKWVWITFPTIWKLFILSKWY